MNKKTIKPNTDLIFARFAILGMVAIVFTVLSINGLPSWFMWLVMLWGVFSIFSAAIQADESAAEAEATQSGMNQLKWLVNHQHKIIKQHDQSLGRMLEFKGHVKDHVSNLRNKGLPQIITQLDNLDYLIKAYSQKCECTNLPVSNNFFSKLIVCHQCGKEYLM